MNNQKSTPNFASGSRLKGYITGLITAALTIALGSFILAIIYTKTEVTTSTIELFQYGLLALAGLLAGISSSKNIHKDGLVNGAILGLLISIAMFAYNGYEFQLATLAIKVAIIMLSTIFGGIIGV